MLFTFPSRYLFTIGRWVVFSLWRWASWIPTGFHVPRSTRVVIYAAARPFAYRAFTFCGGPFQDLLLDRQFVTAPGRYSTLKYDSHNPMLKTAVTLQQHGLGSSPFARRYSGNRGFFLFLGVLRCFSSPGWPLPPMDSVTDTVV